MAVDGGVAKQLPDHYPAWSRELGELYFSGTTNTFLLHGNTSDLVHASDRFLTLKQFVAFSLFGQWDLVLYYDLSTGLRVMGGFEVEKQREMATLAASRIGDLKSVGKDPTVVLHVLDRFLDSNVMADDKRRVSVAVILGHSSFVARRGDRSLKNSTHVVTLLNWAASPYVKRINTAFVLIDGTLNDLSERLVNNPHTASIEIPLPDVEARSRYLEHVTSDLDLEAHSDYDVEAIAKLTAGISLVDLRVLVDGTVGNGRRLDADRFRDLKKTLIERQAGGFLEFIEPSWGLDMVIGHEAAKARLEEDAELLKRGALQSVPMGYLFCGPVGTGKSFLAQCLAGRIGIPCVKLKNFRGGLVGDTERNLELVLTVLRSMGPVMVIVDEADAMLGDRRSGGDAGVSGRVFGMFAQQMGDTQYRGKILWMLLTTRPDYLPIDLKRQGRAEVHVPLFYPTQDEELRQMFFVLARKLDAKLAEEDVPTVPPEKRGQLSGADVEGILGRAWRKSQIAGADRITKESLQEAVDGFMPMAQSLERQLQTLAAIVECTDQEFLPQGVRDKMKELGGRSGVQERLTQLKTVVDGE